VPLTHNPARRRARVAALERAQAPRYGVSRSRTRADRPRTLRNARRGGAA
jgi:hypothetical protein